MSLSLKNLALCTRHSVHARLRRIKQCGGDRVGPGNCGTWERSSASDRASDFASACASSTQSQQFARHFCECNVNCKVTTVIPHFLVILNGQSISGIIFMTLQGQKVNFKVKQETCVGLIPLFHRILT